MNNLISSFFLIIKYFRFIIKSPEGKTKSIEMPVYVVDIPALNNLSQEMRLSAYQIDTIIGLDFLMSEK